MKADLGRARLLDRVAMVTGGAGGLGSAICRALAQEGARIAILVNQNLTGGQRLASELKDSYGVEAEAIKADVSQGDQVRAAVAAVRKRWDRLDILVNNAGITTPSKIEEISEEEWDRVVAVNLKGHFLCAQSAIPHLKGSPCGRIINMGSLVAKNGGIISGGVYATTKGAIHSFTYVLAKELAPHRITVNAVAPGPINTEMIQAMPEDKVKLMIDNIPLRRLGRVEEVGQTVAFLASDQAAYITGEVLDINGGAYTD